MELLLIYGVDSVALTALISSSKGWMYSGLAARSNRTLVTDIEVVWIEAVLVLSCIWAWISGSCAPCCWLFFRFQRHMFCGAVASSKIFGIFLDHGP